MKLVRLFALSSIVISAFIIVACKMDRGGDAGLPPMVEEIVLANQSGNRFNDGRDGIVLTGPKVDATEEDLSGWKYFLSFFIDEGFTERELLNRDSWWEWDQDKVNKFVDIAGKAFKGIINWKAERFYSRNANNKTINGDHEQPIEIPFDLIYDIIVLPAPRDQKK